MSTTINSCAEMAPIMPLLEDDSINDVLINRYDRVYIERYGKLELTDVRFPSEDDVLAVAKHITEDAGREFNPKRPLVDARLSDGSRVNVISPPLSVDGTSISIRKFSKQIITLDKMAEQENMSMELANFLKICGKCHLNAVVSGGTGSGKTTLLNAISQHIDDDERVVTIEDAAELRLDQPNLVRLETKPAHIHGDVATEVSIRDLVKNALRMRPDRIIVGEVRGAEAFDMMQAMNTGHDGSLTTIHANHPRDALSRVENMINMANLNLPAKTIRYQIASAVQLVVQISRQRDGHRRITHVSEVVGMETDTITMQDLFLFQPTGEKEDGSIAGTYKWTGIMPRFLRRVAYYGELDALSKTLGVRLHV